MLSLADELTFVILRMMRVLFAISLLALAGLLWAAFAAARHIRKARKRRRLARAMAAAARKELLNPLLSSVRLSGLPPTGVVAPPPLPTSSMVDWEDVDGIDPLSEVTCNSSPVDRNDAARRRFAGAATDRVDRVYPSEGISLGTTPEGNLPGESASVHDRFKTSLPQARPARRTHSLHVHG